MKVTGNMDGTVVLDFNNTNGPSIVLGRVQAKMLYDAIIAEVVRHATDERGQQPCPACRQRTLYTICKLDGELFAVCVRCDEQLMVTELGLMRIGPWECGTIASEAQDDPTT